MLTPVLSGGCTASLDQPNGCIVYSPAVPPVAHLGRVCATQLDGEWAVSMKHGRWQLWESGTVETVETIEDPDYDLVFFRHQGTAPIWRDAVVGESVTAEGDSSSPWLDQLVGLPVPTSETAIGNVHATDLQWCGTKDTPLRCTDTIRFTAEVEHGDSGGPVIGGVDGAIVGITAARITDGPFEGEGIALPTALVWSEFQRLVLDAKAASPAPAGAAPATVDASEPELRQALADADRPCQRQLTYVELVSCEGDAERPVWQRMAPSTLDLFEIFDHKRTVIARSAANGHLPAAVASRSLAANSDELWAEFRARQAAAGQAQDGR